MKKPTDDQIVIAGIAIVYRTKLQVSPGHERGRIGPPLTIQAKDIPDMLKEQILAIAHEHAGHYWKTKVPFEPR